MPELPEIINFKTYIDATALHQPIHEVEVNNDGVLADCSPEDLEGHLRDREFKSTSTHGKYLFLHTHSDKDLMMHFGMTGEPVYYKKEDKQPGYPRVVFHFGNGFHLAFNCMRMLGKISLLKDKESFLKQKEIGPDVFSESFDLKTFAQLLDGRRGMIKSALMDQSLMAGIGNECSDEILYQARIHPKEKISSLSDDTIRLIYKTIQEVLQVKIDSDLQIDNLPQNYILRHREEGADCPRCSEAIQQISVGGRTGYYCPGCQE